MKQLDHRNYPDLRLNMSETIDHLFNVLFNDDSWTWSGLAYILVEKFGLADLGELDMAIKNELKERNLLEDYKEEINDQ